MKVDSMLSKRKFLKKIFFLPFSFFFINSTNKADAHSKKIEQLSDISGISKNEKSDTQIAAQEILIKQGGTVQNALVSIYVDGFGADPTGATDSTASILKAIESLNKTADSRYIRGNETYGEVIFGNGTYMIGDIPFLSGVRYRGQGQWATRIKPTPNARFCFTSLNTTDYYKKRVSGRLLQAGLFDLSIGFGYQEKLENPTSKAGAIYLAYASYFTLSNILIQYLDGEGIRMEQVWDSDFSNLRIMYIGNNNVRRAKAALYIGPGNSEHDGSNALRFRGLHIENCAQLLYLDKATRHIFFTSPKFESVIESKSSFITGAFGICFDCAELTWGTPDIPMFKIFEDENDIRSINKSITFDSPILISPPEKNKHGWYFSYSSTSGYLVINNLSAINVFKIAVGNKVRVNNGVCIDSAAQLFNFYGDSLIHHFSFSNLNYDTNSDIKSIIEINGDNCSVENCDFNLETALEGEYSAISVINPAKWIRISKNFFSGASHAYIIINNETGDGWINDNYVAEITGGELLLKKDSKQPQLNHQTSKE